MWCCQAFVNYVHRALCESISTAVCGYNIVFCVDVMCRACFDSSTMPSKHSAFMYNQVSSMIVESFCLRKKPRINSVRVNCVYDLFELF